MSYLLTLLIFLAFAGIAMTINEGLWSNTITYLCLVISGLAGAIGGVPLGMMIFDQAGQGGEFAWYFVFAGMWLVFSLTMLILRILTDKASKVRVRFLPIVDKIGGWVMCILVASMLEGFAAYTLLVAPVNAGEWKPDNDQQRPRMERAAGPFTLVLVNFVKSDQIDLPLINSGS